MELNAVNSMMAEGGQAEEIAVKFNSGHRRSRVLEDSVGGRPNSPIYNAANEATASDECFCSNPSRIIGA